MLWPLFAEDAFSMQIEDQAPAAVKVSIIILLLFL